MADLIGRTIGNYLVSREVGRGGMGAVYLAEHPRIRRKVAVKVLHGDASADPEMVARFFNEARAASDIHDAHIVEILDFGELPEGTSYIVMEWLEGRALGTVLDDEGRLSLPRAAHITAGIGRALTAAHAHGVIHRDLKPDNVFLVERDGDPDFVKVLDFGIAKLLAPGDGPSPRTRTNTVMGTPAYMSPEQCRGESSTLDARSDIYSLGVMLYEMVTGRRPFLSETYTGVLVAHITQPPPPPRTLDPSIPEAVERVLLKALEKERDKRHARIEDLVAEFVAAAAVSGATLVAAAAPPVGAAAVRATPRGTTPASSALPSALPSDTVASAPPSAIAAAPASAKSAGAGGPVIIEPRTPTAPAPGAPPAPEAPRPDRVSATHDVARRNAAPRWTLALFAIGALALVSVVAAAVMRSGHHTATASSHDSPATTAVTASPTATAPPIAAATPVPTGAAPTTPAAAPPVSPTSSAPAKHERPTTSPIKKSFAQPAAPAPAAAAPTPPPREHPAAHASEKPAVLDPYAAAAAPPALIDHPAPKHAASIEEKGGDELDRRLSAEATRLAPGLRRYGPKIRGQGGDGEGQDRFVELEGGRCYTFVSVGASTMPQLYTYLWDTDGKRLADHRSSNTTSSFNACTTVSGLYRFQAKPAHGPGEFLTAVYYSPR